MLHWTLIHYTNTFDKTSETYSAQRPENHLGLPKYLRLKLSKLAYKLVLRATAIHILVKFGANV